MSQHHHRGLIALGLAAGLALLTFMQLRANARQAPREVPVARRPAVLAAPAVIEPVSKVVALRSPIQGRLKAVYVESGGAVKAGQVVAELENDIQRALVGVRQAELRRAQAKLAALEAGTRAEQLLQAKSELARAAASLSLARINKARAETLAARGVRSAHARDAARAEEQVALAIRDKAAARHAELEAGPRAEAILEAKAEVTRAEAALALATSQLKETRIESPIDGLCVYRYREPGEVVGRQSDTVPVLTVASSQPLRLRADVDASDIARVEIGQRVSATAPAFGERVFLGKVVKRERVVGRKNIRTDRPREKVDTKVLEVLIELDAGAETALPLGLEMTVRFLKS